MYVWRETILELRKLLQRKGDEVMKESDKVLFESTVLC